jgi:hypothetical protein
MLRRGTCIVYLDRTTRVQIHGPGRSVIYTHRGTYSCDHHSTFWCQVRLRKPKPPSFGILRLFLRHKVTNENVHIRSHSIFREPRMYSRNRYLDHRPSLDTLLGTEIQLKTLSTDKVFAEQASIMTAYTNTFASSRIDLDAIEFVQLDDSVQVYVSAS